MYILYLDPKDSKRVRMGSQTVSASKVPNRSMAHEEHVLTRGTRGEENLVRHDVPVL